MYVEVLFIDDEKGVVKSLTRLMRREGISSFSCLSAEQALNWLQTNTVSLIVSDYLMTGMSGTELLAKVEARWPDTGRIILSGHADFDTVLKAVHTGVVHKFLAKPWENQELLEHIKTSLASQLRIKHPENYQANNYHKNCPENCDPSDIKLQAVLDTVVDGVITINGMGIIGSVNRSTEGIFGYRSSELVGKNISMLMPEPYRSQHDHYLKEYSSPGLKGILGNQRRLVGLRKDGEVFPIELSVNSMEIDGDTQFLGMIRDISRRVVAESQNQLLLDALEVAQYGVALFGAGDRLIHWNKQFTELYKEKRIDLYEGLTYEDFFRQCLSRDLFISEGVDSEKWLSQQLAMHDELPVSVEYQLTSGQWLEIRESQAENGSVIVSHFDISKQKQAQVSLERAVAEAEHANSARGRFLAMMSHEIRTPLNGVLGILQLLQNTQLTEEQTDYIQHAVSAGDGLLTIISDILDFSKIEADKLELISSPCQLSTLISELEQLFRLRVEEKSIQLITTVDSSLPKWVELDGHRLRQVLLNLMGNAIKFTDYGEVSLQVKVEGDMLVFNVTDTGLGIPLSEQNKVFTEFTTIDHHLKHNQNEGTGLGLAISHKLVSLMGGEISFTSEQGVGTSFTFNIPLVLAEPTEIEQPKDQLAIRGRVLVVDDSSTNRLVAKAMLENEGVSVICASSGVEAIAIYSSAEQIDLILMDISMPGMDGVETFHRLQQLKGWKQTPVIAFTAHVQLDAKQEFLNEGMQDHLEKPLDKSILLQTISPYLSCMHENESYDCIVEEPIENALLLDIAKLDQLARDTSDEVLPELVNVFKSDARSRLNSLAKVEIEESEAKRHFHTLGSSGALYGLIELANKARKLESLCVEGKDFKEELQDFLEMATESLQVLDNHMSERNH
ncbi:response regulator [Neptuniibacter sp.]|uniref:response regulator n=1 Tax=Neptuniibacter sp. TaxID=1962643 RepID=UPI003B5A52CD